MKDIKGYEGLYAVTEDGQVWSYPRQWQSGPTRTTTKSHNGKFLKPSIGDVGYPVVVLVKDGKSTQKRLHNLVAATYLPPVEGKTYVNHIDNIKTHNHYTNLEWCTPKENIQHAMRLGLMKIPAPKHGSTSPNAKLTEHQVLQIRALYPTLTLKEIGHRYAVSMYTIWDVIHRKTWNHI